MSVTTVANPTTTHLHRSLHDDYSIHLTGSEIESVNERQKPEVENPDEWPTDYHGVPPYRPINRNLDPEARNGSTNPVERLFIYTMLHGVWLNAVSETW
jgi:hypothetical protein